MSNIQVQKSKESIAQEKNQIMANNQNEREMQQEQVHFVRSEDNFYVETFNPNQHREHKLGAGFYSLEYNGILEVFYLRLMEIQSMPSKIYGDVMSRTNRILNTFESRGVNTGVLLYGMKGTGKSLLSRQVCLSAVEKGLPVIFISVAYSGPKFVKFMESIEQACVINVDEFEKTYKNDEGQQENLLSMMDGVSKQNKLWLLTVNNKHMVNSFMINRPGRIFYKFEYGVLPIELVEEVCKDKGLDKNKIDNLLSVYSLIEELTFDVLMAIIEDSKRYNEMPVETLKLLNVEMSDTKRMYSPKVQLVVDGVATEKAEVENFDTTAKQIYLDSDDKILAPILQKLAWFHPDVKEGFEQFIEDGGEAKDFDIEEYDYNYLEIELVALNGRKGIREYEILGLLDEGFHKMEGVKKPNFKVVVSPNNEKKKDLTSYASAYSGE